MELNSVNTLAGEVSPKPVNYKAEKKNFSRIGLGMFLYSIFYFVVQIIGMTLVGMCGETVQMNFGVIASMVPGYIICIPLLFLFLKKTALPCEIHKEKLSVGRLFAAFLVAEAFMYAGNIVGNIINALVSLIPGFVERNPLQDLLGQTSMWQTIIVVAIAAPIAEELVFRKALIDRLGRYGDKIAIVVSAAAFALFHGNIIQFVYAFLVGLVLGYVYRKTGNILYSIIIHVLMNFNGSVLSQLVLEKSGYMDIMQQAAGGAEISTEMLMEHAGGMLMFALYSLVLLAMVVAGFAIFLINKKKLTLREGEVSVEKDKRFSTIALNVGAILYIVLWLIMTVIALLG